MLQQIGVPYVWRPSLENHTLINVFTHYVSIIHNFVGTSFQRHYVVNDKHTFSGRSFKSEAHVRRLAVYFGNSDSRALQENILSSNTKSRECAKFGKKVVKHAPSNRWLFCWIRRELQALMQEEDVNILVHHVVGMIESFQSRKGEASVSSKINLENSSWLSAVSSAVRPFIFEHATKFVEELEKFLFSGLDIAAYDQLTTLQNPDLPISSEATFLAETVVTTESLEVSRHLPDQADALHSVEHHKGNTSFLPDDGNLDRAYPLSSSEPAVFQQNAACLPEVLNNEAFVVVRENSSEMKDHSQAERRAERDCRKHDSGSTSQRKSKIRSFSRKYKQRNKKKHHSRSNYKAKLQEKTRKRKKSFRRQHQRPSSSEDSSRSSSSYANTSSSNTGSSSSSDCSDSSISRRRDIRRKRLLLQNSFSKRSEKKLKTTNNAAENLVDVPAKNWKISDDDCQNSLQKNGIRPEPKKHRKIQSMDSVKNRCLDYKQGEVSLVDFSEAAPPLAHLKDGEMPCDQIAIRSSEHILESADMFFEDEMKQKRHDSRSRLRAKLQNETAQAKLLEVRLRQQALINLRRYQTLHQEETVREATLTHSENLNDLEALRMSDAETCAEITLPRDTSIKYDPPSMSSSIMQPQLCDRHEGKSDPSVVRVSCQRSTDSVSLRDVSAKGVASFSFLATTTIMNSTISLDVLDSSGNYTSDKQNLESDGQPLSKVPYFQAAKLSTAEPICNLNMSIETPCMGDKGLQVTENNQSLCIEENEVKEGYIVSTVGATANGTLNSETHQTGGKFQQKSMSVMRGGELVEVNYKVYIPQHSSLVAARRKITRQ
ncbi:hypothetical protein O6H91_21G016500 [Diphasiastrum complanatum]|uniref:Uncharacterized protein n=1 Tax=Diphasiastrum complanatum TaxID=34168 RepID=A0ACC2AIA9_DIPCM|nr:hypothetical protein O6H91_21G016500 [Diphasiastrum complanatum]